MKPELTHHFIEMNTDKAPERPLCLFDGKTASYGEVEQLANRIARALVTLGVEKGDRVALLIENSMYYIAAYYGILKAGAVTVSIFTTTNQKNLAYILNDCAVKILITRAKFLRMIEGRENKFPTLQGLIHFDNKTLDWQWPRQIFSLAQIEKLPDVRFQRDIIDADLASIVYTSGSTGDPRGAMLSHLNLVTNTHSIVSYLKLSANDRIMVVLPFPYVYGKSLLNTHVSVGGSVLIDNRFLFPNLVLKTMQLYEATGFSGVPSTYAILLGKSAVGKMEFPALRYLTQAGGAMAPSLIRRAIEVFKGKQVYIMYGATEAGARLSFLSPDELPRKIGSIGKAIPNVRLQVIKEDGSTAKPGEAGEIMAQGSNIMRGYWNQPEETRAVLTEHGFHTGDLAYKDEEGYLYIVGRKRDMIKSGAHRVSAKEIEEIILEQPLVLETAVIGVLDPYLGEAICAYVTLKPGTMNCNNARVVEEIISFCRERLPDFKVPRQVIVQDNLPKSESGKILKTVLRSRHVDSAT